MHEGRVVKGSTVEGVVFHFVDGSGLFTVAYKNNGQKNCMQHTPTPTSTSQEGAFALEGEDRTSPKKDTSTHKGDVTVVLCVWGLTHVHKMKTYSEGHQNTHISSTHAHTHAEIHTQLQSPPPTQPSKHTQRTVAE